MSIGRADVSEGLQRPFPQKRLKVVDLPLFRHLRLHLDQSVKEVFEQFKLLTLAVKAYCVVVDRTNSESLGGWSILHASQDVS